MTEPPARSRPTSGSGSGLGFLTAAVAVAAWAFALTRPWGDVGVADGGLVTGRPVALAVLLGVGAVAGLGLAVTGGRLPRWWALGGAAALTALGAVLLVATAATASAQVLPRDGSWWGLLAAVAVTLTGGLVALLVLAGVVRRTGRRGRLVRPVVTVLAVVVPVALVATGIVVAPGWASHRVGSVHPAGSGESPGPTTVDHLAWEQPVGDDLVAVIGGRLVVARDTTGADGCSLSVQALDAGSRARIWSVRRPLRCDGPRLAVLDGNNSTVRLVLRGETDGTPFTGPPLALYLGLEDGRSSTPSADLDRVQAWTEGFGLVLTAATLEGLDSRTGATVWSRPLPACGDRVATVGVPAAVPAGQRAARTPYDGGRPNGTVPMVSAGGDLVVGTSCATGGTITRSVWAIDVLHGPAGDRTVVLPAPVPPEDETLGAPAGEDVPTTFVSWLDTVVAAVPVGDPDADRDRVALVGVDRPSGTVLWNRPAAFVRTVDVSPADGLVSVSGPPAGYGDRAAFGTTDVLGARTGEVLASRGEPSPVLASVALAGGRVEIAANQTFVVRDPVTGRTGDTLPTDRCRPVVDAGAAPVLAGPGGVVLRCGADDPRLVGLVDQP